MPTYLIEGNATKVGAHQKRDSNILEPPNSVDILLINNRPRTFQMNPKTSSLQIAYVRRFQLQNEATRLLPNE